MWSEKNLIHLFLYLFLRLLLFPQGLLQHVSLLQQRPKILGVLTVLL